jgi:hypothetical protein
MVRRLPVVLVAASVGLGALGVGSATAQIAPARFVTVEQGPDELKADEALAFGLGGTLAGSPDRLPYESVIDTLLDDAREGNPTARAGGVIARVTPYAFVVAEMRGARIDLLATCRSKSTGKTVTNAFLVVPRSAFPGTVAPTLDQLLAHVRALSDDKRPARFIYHNKYSTSSYFLPSLLFRARRVFGVSDGEPRPAGVTTLLVERSRSSSSASDLIRAVAAQAGEGETIASVWNGPRSNFAGPDARFFAQGGNRVHFVPLPDDLPCDLLVATRKVSSATKDAIAARLRQLQPADLEAPDSDVAAWVPWPGPAAEDARRALSELRRQAGASTQSVVVDVQSNALSPVRGELLDAARQAIRLAGTELVDRSQYFDYYQKNDIRWELEKIHDGAVRLTVRYENFRQDDREVAQQFDVSFQQPGDLTRRLVSLVHSRMYRIRSVWPYNDAAPTVLRDVDYDVAAHVPFQLIQWTEPLRNDYQLAGASGVTDVDKEEPFEIRLKTVPAFQNLEPMGQRSLRVLLMRVTPERLLFQVLTVLFVVLLVAAAAGFVWDLWRWQRRQRGRARRLASPAPARAVLPHAATGEMAVEGQ